ncbi:hypothetical protein V1477_019914 [Vespula maculifrons]|uniref:Uncharacterized protein n=1 Tax=Vespula maculifrons TaxID=7453 RepID=A0ABD2AKG1_VESMC
MNRLEHCNGENSSISLNLNVCDVTSCNKNYFIEKVQNVKKTETIKTGCLSQLEAFRFRL